MRRRFDETALRELLRHYPAFSRFVEPVVETSPLQAKAVQALLSTRDETYRQRAELFAKNMLSLLDEQGIDIGYVVDSYLKLCWNMLAEQTRFKKTGRYSRHSQAEALAVVYHSEQKMSAYMYGLALSQFLWPNHYGMFDFFIAESRKLAPIDTYLEIGPGHGLFLVEALSAFPEARIKVVDISPTSIEISRSVVSHFAGRGDCEFVVQDVADIGAGEFDYIVMCEVLEHLDDPLAILGKVRGLMSDESHLFITTCANCPAIDHVYLYESVDHIRREIGAAGFSVVRDLALPVGEYDESEWAEQKVEVNYAALLKKA